VTAKVKKEKTIERKEGERKAFESMAEGKKAGDIYD